MIILPAIDLLEGRVVKLESRKHKSVEKVYGTPREVAKRWFDAGARVLHLIDLNAAFGQRRNWLPLMEIAAEADAHGGTFMVGGGFRTDENLDFFLSRGGDPSEIEHVVQSYQVFTAETGSKLPYPAFWSTLDSVIVGTRAITDFGWLEKTAARYPNKLIVAIDAIGRRVVVEGWQKDANVDVVEFARRCKDLPLHGLLYTNVDVEGKGEGVKWAPIEDIIIHSPKPVIFSGGVTSVDEIRMFKSLGALGVVVGSSLYAGKIDFQEALEAAK